MGRVRGTPARWAAGAVAAYLVLVVGVLVAEGGNPEWFVHFGSDPSRSAANPLAREVFGDDVRTPNLDGHDGQGFWVQARDPLLVDPAEAREFHDRPVYRSQRVLYPLLVAPFGLLGDHALVFGMVAVNLAAVGLGTWAAARLARRRSAHRWAPLAFAGVPGVFLAVTLSTADALAVALVLVALDAVDRGDDGSAGVALAAAALAKEPMVLAAAALAARAVLAGRGGWRSAARLALPSAVAVGAWALYVRLRLGFAPTEVQEFTAPLWGYVDAWRRQWVPFGDWAQFGVAVATLVVAALAVRQFWVGRSLLAWTALPFALAVPFFSAQVLGLSTNPPRAIGPLLTLVLLEAAAGRHRKPHPAPEAGQAARPAAGPAGG